MAEGVYCHPLGPDVTRVRSDLTVPNHRLWELNDPVLYRVAVEASRHGCADEKQVRFGFRDFRFEDGFFRLNGRRILVKGSNHISGYPIGYTVPPDEDMLRRDVLHTKALGYNAIRVGFGGMIARQLDLFDELGILVHQEHFGSWQLQDSPNMALRLDRSIGEVILRPEPPERGPVGPAQRARQRCPLPACGAAWLGSGAALDTTRMAVLNSGRSDFAYALGSFSNPGSNTWDVSVTDLLDLHGYPWVPFSPAMLDVLRTGNHPELIWGVYSWVQSKAPNAAIFLTEYGLCSPMDLPMLVRHYERAGRAEADDAVYLHGQLDKFLADWKRWALDETRPRPEDYFEQGIRKTAELRRMGILPCERTVGSSVSSPPRHRRLCGPGRWFGQLVP